jgi:hypothetical protein
MQIEHDIPFAVIPITVIAGVLSLSCTLWGAVMTFFVIGPVDRLTVTFAFMFLPLLAFPIFLSSLYSMKTCRNWFSAYFIVYLLVGVINEGNNFRLVHLFELSGIVVMLAIVTLLNVAYLLIRRALRDSNEEIPGVVNIMTR